MTMRTLLTAAAIISSAIGVGEAPSPIPHMTPASRGWESPGANTQLSEEFASLDQQATHTSTRGVGQGGSCDSLYRLAREAMSRGDYKRAAELFRLIPQRFPQSAYAGQACITRPTRSIGAAAKMT